MDRLAAERLEASGKRHALAAVLGELLRSTLGCRERWLVVELIVADLELGVLSLARHCSSVACCLSRYSCECTVTNLPGGEPISETPSPYIS